jgi:DNA-binding transcriptional MerR regulator
LKANGYRDYPEALADRVVQIRGLLDAGLPTRIIQQVLPCPDDPLARAWRRRTPGWTPASGA